MRGSAVRAWMAGGAGWLAVLAVRSFSSMQLSAENLFGLPKRGLCSYCLGECSGKKGAAKAAPFPVRNPLTIGRRQARGSSALTGTSPAQTADA